MRSPAKMDTIQIELTNACVLACSNCTRFVGHRTPFFMELEDFKRAIGSLEGFSGIVGFMGGEPLLHPQFEKFCEYALSVRSRDKLGLWSVFPDAPKYKRYRDIITNTFGNILLNDHTMDNIMHGPLLVGIQEYATKTGMSDADMWRFIDDCWIQNTWSAAINPKGAFFCEVAAAMSLLYDGPRGWDIEKDWWKRTPKDFKEQMEAYCTRCGCSLPLKRRASVEEIDDISPENLEALANSKRVRDGKYVESTFDMDINVIKPDTGMYPDQVYKEELYRKGIAARYGIRLMMTERGYWEPQLMDEDEAELVAKNALKPTLYQIMKAKYDTRVGA